MLLDIFQFIKRCGYSYAYDQDWIEPPRLVKIQSNSTFLNLGSCTSDAVQDSGTHAAVKCLKFTSFTFFKYGSSCASFWGMDACRSRASMSQVCRNCKNICGPGEPTTSNRRIIWPASGRDSMRSSRRTVLDGVTSLVTKIWYKRRLKAK